MSKRMLLGDLYPQFSIDKKIQNGQFVTGDIFRKKTSRVIESSS